MLVTMRENVSVHYNLKHFLMFFCRHHSKRVLMRDLKEDNEVVWQMLGKNHRGACLKLSDKWVMEANIMV